MCIYYLISFTKSIYFLLNFQIPFMFWITILPLNILYYPTNESIRFSNNLIFLTVLRFIVISATFLPGLCRLFSSFWAGFGAVLGISAVSATFSWLFSGFLAKFGSCFGDFCSFSYFFSAFFRLFGWVWGAVLGISAVSATFYRFFSGFLAEFEELFWGFAVPATFYRFFSGFLAEFGLFLLHLVGTKSELPLLAFWPAHLL